MILFLICLLIILELIAVAYENSSFAFFILFLGAMAIHFLTDVDMIMVITNAVSSVTFWAYVVAYFFIGIVWSFSKFYIVLIEWANKYNRYYKEFNQNQDNMPAYWSDCNQYVFYKAGNKPEFNSYRSRTINWILWWPFSIIWTIWTIVNDLVKNIGTWIYQTLIDVYRAIYDHVIGSLKIED